MLSGNGISTNTETMRRDCPFCQSERIATYILKETTAFRLVADHAPLVAGHLLIIPKQHYACYGAVPAEYDRELFALKDEVRAFFEQFYAAPAFWEHGVFRQTVFHAHLHCFPFGKTEYLLTDARHSHLISSQEDIRSWYTMHGHYFYLDDSYHGLLFAPEMDDYMHITQKVLRPAANARNQRSGWRSAQQRQVEGKPLIEAVKKNWQIFQEQAEEKEQQAL